MTRFSFRFFGRAASIPQDLEHGMADAPPPYALIPKPPTYTEFPPSPISSAGPSSAPSRDVAEVPEAYAYTVPKSTIPPEHEAPLPSVNGLSLAPKPPAARVSVALPYIPWDHVRTTLREATTHAAMGIIFLGFCAGVGVVSAAFCGGLGWSVWKETEPFAGESSAVTWQVNVGGALLGPAIGLAFFVAYVRSVWREEDRDERETSWEMLFIGGSFVVAFFTGPFGQALGAAVIRYTRPSPVTAVDALRLGMTGWGMCLASLAMLSILGYTCSHK